MRDAEQAYIQSDIDTPGRPQTFVRLPRSWWPSAWFNKDGSSKYDDPVCLLRKSLYGHPESGPLWDKKMNKVMKMLGYVPIESSPGVFYHPVHDCEVTVYVDDFIMYAPPHIESKLWSELEKEITFKDPPVVLDRYLGVYHEFEILKDGTDVMATHMTDFLIDAAKIYMKERGITTLPFVHTPYLDEKFDDSPNPIPGKMAKTCASHLMKVLYAARLTRADLIVATTLLARRVSKWYADEDRRLERLMAYIFHHAGLKQYHTLHPDDCKTAVLVYSPDAELGSDTSSTKSSYGMWLALESEDGKRSWPLGWFCKKAGHTSCSTADSEVYALIGANDVGLKREVIPTLEQLEISLNRPVKLICKEDNTQCIAAVKRGYSPSLRYLKRHTRCSLGFCHEVFFHDPDEGVARYDAHLEYCPSADQQGDWMTKALDKGAFIAARTRAGIK